MVVCIINNYNFIGFIIYIYYSLYFFFKKMIVSSRIIITDFKVIHLFDFKYIVRMAFIMNGQPYPLTSISINDKIYKYENLASGDLSNGVFEFIWDYKFYINTISIRTFANNVYTLNSNDFYSIGPNKRITFPTFKSNYKFIYIFIY